MWVEIALNIALERFFTYHVPKELEGQVEIGKRAVISFKSASKKRVLPKKIAKQKFEDNILENLSEENRTFILKYYQLKTKQYSIIEDISEDDEKKILDILKTIRGKTVGLIVGISDQKPPFKTLPIEKILDPVSLLPSYWLEIAQWIANYYGCTLLESIALFWTSAKKTAELPSLKDKPLEVSALNEEQQGVFEEIDKKLKFFYPALIFGITGSGKTEVYRHLVKSCVEKGMQAIVLVPEISLTPQTVARFSSLFGESKVALIHSKMTPEEKLANYYRIRNKEAMIILGPRSALFTPVEALGLIIIDEEHENSYKSSESPRYHARQVAFKIAQKLQIPLILGSATPSIETFYAAKNNKIKLFYLKNRFAGIKLPTVKIINMKEEKGDFSKELVQKVYLMKQNGYQSILFMNRRGFSTFMLCKKCGYKFQCPNCSVSLTYHKKQDSYSCHYCGYFIKKPSECPSCKSPELSQSGIGTEKLEEEIQNLFHNFKIIRMDRDTTSKKGSHEKILETVKSGKADILVGTQMIAKGLNIDKAKLVGVVMADISLNLPDFRSGENTFSLLTQVAGRSGRKEEGEVLIQTYLPQNYIIQKVQTHDYEGFYEREIESRQQYNYPPFTRIVRLVVRGENPDFVSHAVNKIAEILQSHKIIYIGPSPCPLEKINKNFRHHIFMKTNRVQPIVKLVKEKILPQFNSSGRVYVEIDVDPVSML